ncbi:cadherin-like beta sandwich domain-containing protein [Paenibacillus sp. CF384]|uniref:cadherin-like beta sandwich domain-containing protein n=1 Tax=Paenibacillus sp. CF384 TaxID=1884382 RepID=UPI00089C6288|nr:cadherin-like beta sandwich domain-containing protein [Paenibacillus sp. CF384]SDX46666.1 Cadherin-like beta sandwich domain-containing protein [Paenibacillus sp. CF384]
MIKLRKQIALFLIMSMLAALLVLPASVNAAADPAQFNFETNTQGFTGTAGATLAVTTEKAYQGNQSMKMTLNVTGSAGPFAKLSSPAGLTAGSTYEFHIWVPSGASIAGVQPYMMDSTWSWTGNYVPYANLTKDAWNTMTLTIPAGAKTPFNEFGVQVQSSGDFAGSVYIDSIGIQGGTPVEVPNPAGLSDLRVNGTTVAGFTSKDLSYIAHVPNGTASAAVTATTTAADAAVTITGGSNLGVGENAVTVEVTAKDLTKQTYTIRLIRDLPSSQGNHITIQGTSFNAGHERIWFNGANTPWDNWNDFGGDFDYDFWDTHFALLHANGVNASRVWITSNGEVGINIDANGYVSGATAAHWNDLDSLFYLAQKHGVYIMATLLSFDHMKNSHPSYDSWRKMLMSESNIDSYVSNYVIPFTNRYKDNPYLWSIDFMNEPDWVFEESKLPWENLQSLFAKMSVGVHANSSVLTTVGVAMIKYNSDTCTEGCQGNKVGDGVLMAKAGGNPQAKLDFWSPHYYDWMGQYWGNPMYMTPEQFGLSADRPAVIGETAALGTTGHTLTQDYVSAYTNGWQGMMPWTSNGVDGLGDLTRVGPAASSFYNQHPDLVFPSGISKNANLSDLKVDGVTVAGFSADTLSYSLQVPNDKTSIAVTTTADPYATVAVNGGTSLAVGTNTATVMVTAENGSSKVYTLTITRAKSSNTALSELKINGQSLIALVPGKLTYSVTVPNSTIVVYVSAKAASETAKVSVDPALSLVIGSNQVNVQVTAEDGTKQTYTITITRAKSSNANLIGLFIDGKPVPGFSPDKLAYKVNVSKNTKSVQVTALTVFPTAKAAITGGSSLVKGNNTVTVKVTAPDGTTQQTYTITVVRG